MRGIILTPKVRGGKGGVLMKRSFVATDCGILAAASVVGALEKSGPLGERFDLHSSDDKFGQKTWEKAEAEMQRLALNTALGKGKLDEQAINAIFPGICSISAWVRRMG